MYIPPMVSIEQQKREFSSVMLFIINIILLYILKICPISMKWERIGMALAPSPIIQKDPGSIPNRW